MAYKTDCPECGTDNELCLLSARVYPLKNILVRAEGATIKGSMTVEDLTACCIFCGWAGDVAVVEEEDE